MLGCGDTGYLVEKLQGDLNACDYNAGDVDGRFGKITEDAVIKMQRYHEIEADGVYGAVSDAHLMDELRGFAMSSGSELRYFGESEFKCDCGCGFDVKTELKQKFDLAREILGKPLIITSGYRCKKQNDLDGGVPDSLHMVGEAADCYSPGIGVEVVRDALKGAGLGVVIYYGSGFCHGQLANLGLYWRLVLWPTLRGRSFLIAISL